MTKKSLKSHFEAQIFRPKRSVKHIITILLEFSFIHTMTVSYGGTSIPWMKIQNYIKLSECDCSSKKKNCPDLKPLRNPYQVHLNILNQIDDKISEM